MLEISLSRASLTLFSLRSCTQSAMNPTSAILHGRSLAKKFLFNELRLETEEYHWKSIQREFPGITREEYEADLEVSIQEIRKKYYSEKDYLKPRLIKRNNGGVDNDN